MPESKSLLFICPFWGQTGHVGTIRAHRHVKWLIDEGFKICVVKAGLSDRVEQHAFGELITIKDPLSMFDDNLSDYTNRSVRKPNKLRRYLGYLFLLPDPTILWAKRVQNHPLVLKRARTFNWFMASSPTESAFIPASHFSKALNGKFWMDMRDGWLDEPMKPLLRKSAFHKFRERFLERKMVSAAKIITVTSDNWKKMLQNRYPEFSDKIHVIPNTFEQDTILKNEQDFESNSIKKFMYAGRIYSSRPERNLELLLNTVYHYIEQHNVSIIINFVGTLSSEEEIEIKEWSNKLDRITFIRTPQMPRNVLLQNMSLCDGLLLVSESMGSIPAKFFDYVVSGRPVLGVTRPESAFDLASRNINWVKKIYIDDKNRSETEVADFFDLTTHQSKEVRLPDEFSSDLVRQKLIRIIK